MSTVFGLKLITGEEIIAKAVYNDSEGYWKLDRPRIIGIQQNSQGEVGMGLMPMVLGNPDTEVDIAAEHVLCVYTPVSNVEKTYLSQVSRIQLMS